MCPTPSPQEIFVLKRTMFARCSYATMCVLLLAFAALPVSMFYQRPNSNPVAAGSVLIDLMLIGFLSVWMSIPIVAAALLWRHGVASIRLSSPSPGTIWSRGDLFFIPWTRTESEVDRAWLVRKLTYSKNGNPSISAGVVTRSRGKKRWLMDAEGFPTETLEPLELWLETTAHVPTKDLRRRLIR